MVNTCKELGINEFAIVTSPQAKKIYTKMGAIQIGEVGSLIIKWRKVPQLIYTIKS